MNVHVIFRGPNGLKPVQIDMIETEGGAVEPLADDVERRSVDAITSHVVSDIIVLGIAGTAKFAAHAAVAKFKERFGQHANAEGH
jgi:hypothetical protein